MITQSGISGGEIEGALSLSDPRLTGMSSVFTRLAEGEQMLARRASGRPSRASGPMPLERDKP